MRTVFTLFVVSCAMGLTDCSYGHKFDLQGQIVAVDRGRLELTIKHEDIRGFMPGMTMPFKVRDPRLLEGREPGDLVKATLVVENANAYLTSVERIGHAELDEPPPPPRVDVLEPGQPVPDVPLTSAYAGSVNLTPVTAVPEPSTVALMALGVVTLVALRRRPG